MSRILRLVSAGLCSFAGFAALWFPTSTMAGAVLESGWAWTIPVPVDDDDDDTESLSEDERRQLQIMQRFLGVLEKNPRYGTAMDRVYGHHVEFGSLDSFVQKLRQRAEQRQDGADWMLLGMFEAQRGQDAAAVTAFQTAESLKETDPLVSYYLGQSLLRSGETPAAIAAFERAIERKPQRSDLLEVFQTLGRVHQRAQRIEAAMAVWQRLETLFPEDPRVLEQIALTLADEGAIESALERYQKLAGLTKDDYRRVTFEITAAELTIKLKKRDEGIAQFEILLENLNPDSWLHRDVRRRIENVFLRSADQDGMVAYYERWLTRHPEDVEAMTRLARYLSNSARVPEATSWMEKALKLAPSRSDFRRAFINQLTEDNRIPEALEQYEKLVESAPGNTDFLRDWGKLVLRDRGKSESERHIEATRVWNKILEIRPDDALTVSQVADLFRLNKIGQQAERLYRRAVELAPNDPQYREYLGEFLFLKGETAEAQTVWAAIAEGERRQVANVVRLSEIYNNFGLSELATQEIAAAVALDPKDFALQIRAAEFFLRAGKSHEAMAAVEQALSLAGTEEQRDLVTKQRIEILQASDRLGQEADELWARLIDASSTEIDQWILLAQYLQALQRWPEADRVIDQALHIQPQSVPALTLAAKIAEASGNLARASNMYRNLVTADRRARGEHLMSVSRIELQLGHSDAALAAASELIASAPGNTEHYEFYAQTCFRLGRVEDGLEALRKAVRIDPNQPHLMMALATALSDQLRSEEAIELYWRAFEKAEEVADKALLTTKLADLYQVTNQVDQLIQRLERERREEDKRREMTICLAQAWQTLGDMAAARGELEGLLSEDSRDTTLLNQLAKLCQANGDLEAAISFQRQLVAVAPGEETESPLATMLFASGQVDEARDILVKLTLQEQDPLRQLRSLDGLLRQDNFEAALAVLEPLLAQNREDWELLYREGVCWAYLGKSAEASNRFQRLLAMKKSLDSLGRAAESLFKQAQAKAKSDRLRGTATPPPAPPKLTTTLYKAQQVRQATGLEPVRYYYGPNQNPPLWMPDSFADARLASWGWLLRLEQDAKFGSNDLANRGEDQAPVGVVPGNPAAEARSLADTVVAAARSETGSKDQVLDALLIASLNMDFALRFRLATRLLNGGGRDEQALYLEALASRHQAANQYASESNTANKPLDEADLQTLQQLYELLKAESETEDMSALYTGGQIVYAADGQAYIRIGNQYVALAGAAHGASRARGALIQELKLAGRQTDADALTEEWLSSIRSGSEFVAAMNWAYTEKRFEDLPLFFERWQAETLQEIQQTTTQSASLTGQRTPVVARLQAGVSVVQQWMLELRKAEEYAAIIDVLDKCLTLAEAETSKNQQLASAKSKSQMGQTAQSYYYLYSLAGSQDYRQISVPISRDSSDFLAAVLTLQAHTFLKDTDAENDLTDHLRQRISHSLENQDLDRELHARTYLANYLWLIDEKDEATEEFAQVLSHCPNDIEMHFAFARLLQSRNDFEDALSLIEAIPAIDQKVLQQRELLALSLAERTGNRERALEAAERLFGMRLPAQTQISLVQSLQRLGLNQRADAILARSQRVAANQISSLAALMTLYQGQQKIDEAQQLAHMILRRSTSPVNLSSRTAMNPRQRGQTSDDQYRRQAVQLLNQSGGLRRLIESLEAQLERSPDSLVAIQQLIEFHEALGKRDQVLQLLQNAVQVRPDNHVIRYRLAAALVATSRHGEACDEYLAVLQLQPSWVLENLNEVRQAFATAKRATELFAGLESVSLRNLSQPYSLLSAAMSLIQEEATRDVGLRLFERCLDQYPSYRSYSYQLAGNSALWKVPQVFPLLKRTLLPLPSEILGNPWFGTDSSYSRDPSGYRLPLQDIMIALRGTEELVELQRELTERVEQNPDWLGGQVLMGLLEETNNQTELSQQRFLELAQNPAAVKSMPRIVGVMIAMRLEGNPETQELAMQLLEQSFDKMDDRTGYALVSSSPTGQIIDVMIRNRRFETAERLLRTSISQLDLRGYDEDYALSLRVQNSVWAAERLVKMEKYLDAATLYRASLSEMAVPNVRIDVRVQQAARTGLQAAITKLGKIEAEHLFRFFFPSDTQGKLHDPLVLLDLTVADATQLELKPIASESLTLLQSILENQNLEADFLEFVRSFRLEHPDDLSLVVLHAMLAVRQQSPESKALLGELQRLAVGQPLETIPSGRRPNSRQRRAAEHRAVMWLLAKMCFENPELHEAGEAIAELSLEAARRAGESHEAAILFEWGEALLKANRKSEAEAKWLQILERLTQPPKRAQVIPPQTTQRGGRGDSGVTYVSTPTAISSRDDPVPPLSMSQFRMAMLVARRAADSGFLDLSRRAVRDSLRGGLPIADPVQGDASLAMASLSTRSAGGAGAGFQTSPITNEVVQSVLKVTQLWSKYEDAPIHSYQVLAEIVFPAGRSDIHAFVTATDVWNMQFQSLADALVDAALRADVREDLRTRIQQRKEDPRFATSGDLLEFLLELKSGNRLAALSPLQAIANRPRSGMNLADQLLAYHAAATAFEFPEFRETAFPIMDATLRMPATQDQTSSQLPSLNNRLSTAVLRYTNEQKGESAVRDYYDGILASRIGYYSRFGGSSYGQEMQYADLVAIANQAAQLGLLNVALDYLGRLTDTPNRSYDTTSFRYVTAFCVQRLRQLAPAERYAQWSQWTLPDASRRDVRRAFGMIVPAQVPRVYFTTPESYAAQIDEPLVGNFSELVRAAKAAGQLDELEERVRALVAIESKHADVLLVFVLIEQGSLDEAERLLGQLQDNFSERMTEESRLARTPLTAGEVDFAALLAAIRSPELYAHLEPQLPQIKQRFRTIDRGQLVQWFQWYLDRQRLTPESDSTAISQWLQYWVPVPTYESSGQIPPQIVALDGALLSLGGPDQGDIFFRLPLVGNFQVQLEIGDSTVGNWMGYGGSLVASSTQSMVASVSRHESLQLGYTVRRNSPAYNQLQIAVEDGTVTYSLNGQFLYSENVSPTSPWLMFSAQGTSQSIVQHVQFSGMPEVPNSIPLVVGNSMEGWNCSYFTELQPTHRTQRANDPNGTVPGVAPRAITAVTQSPSLISWRAEDSHLIGAASATVRPDQPSWVYYMRPLGNGDAFEYEFLYDQEHAILHPTIGRQAVLLSADRVRLKWLPSSYSFLLGTVTDFVTEGTPQTVPLKRDQWNRVRVELQKRTVSVFVNNSLVWEQALTHEQSTRFGMYRTKEQAVQAKNLVLHGGWTKDFPSNDQVLALTRPYPEATLMNIASLNDEFGVAVRPVNVLRRVRTLADEDAWQSLVEWVLPSSSHHNFRLYYARHGSYLEDLLPMSGPGSEIRSTERESFVLHSPAIELTRLAVKLDRVDELRRLIDQVQPRVETERRKQDVLRGLLALETGDPTAIDQALDKVWTDVSQPYPKTFWILDRYWDALLAWRAGQHPHAQAKAREIAHQLVKYERDETTTSKLASFRFLVSMIWGQLERRAAAEVHSPPGSPADSDLSIGQWTAVRSQTPADRYMGNQPASWRLSLGQAEHFAGEIPSLLYFQSPLTGSFEVHVERSFANHEPMSVSWGRFDLIPQQDWRSLQVTRNLSNWTELARAVSPRSGGDRYQSRLIVEGSRVEAWIEDQKLTVENLSSPQDPWLIVSARQATNGGRVQGLKILGTPIIPDELNLSQQDRLVGWRADRYGDLIGPPANEYDQRGYHIWQQSDGIIEGTLFQATNSRMFEALLQYQRPLLEDGEIEFETWYEPDAMEVHPAVGLTALLIQPAGIKRHRLTEGAYEVSGLAVDNQEPVTDHPVPLVPNDWNHVRVVLQGDILRLFVNRQQVAEVTLDEPATQRHFGLFRYANLTQCRVRNVLYRGQWPKELPQLESQILANPSP